MIKDRCIYKAFTSRYQKLGVWVWVIAYIGTILAFAGLYFAFPDASWKGAGQMDSFIDSLYFSVVTITSLGFGDVYPYDSYWAKLCVSAEAVGGILIIGFFLNYVAQKQAIRLDKQNREIEEDKKREKAIESLRTYQQILSPVLERYLRGIFMMVTPLEEKFHMPQDIFNHNFNFEYKDLCNLYEQTILMSSDHYVPSVNAHFRNQDITFTELRYFATNADLSYWPELRKLIYEFITLHHQFQFQDIIINAELRTMGNGSKFTTYVANMIAQTDVAPKFESGNMFSPYVALYHYTKANVAVIKGIYGMLENVLNDDWKPERVEGTESGGVQRTDGVE